MELSNLRQGPQCTTLMGCVIGISEHFSHSGHAFMINIQADLSPSAPYVWGKDSLFAALGAMGILRSGEISYDHGQGEDGRRLAEERIKAHLD
jgi:hypothetical protein